MCRVGKVPDGGSRIPADHGDQRSNQELSFGSDAPKDDALFKAAGDAARPFLVSNEKKMNLNITISTSPLGQQGMRGSEPFYIKGQGRVDNLGDDED